MCGQEVHYEPDQSYEIEDHQRLIRTIEKYITLLDDRDQIYQGKLIDQHGVKKGAGQESEAIED